MAAIVFAMIIITSFGIMSVDTLESWKGKLHLYEATIKANPHSYNALRGLGEYYFNGLGEFDKSLQFYENAINLKPRGSQKVLPDYAMAGKVGLSMFVFLGERDENLLSRIEQHLVEGSSDSNYLQARATHDYGYLLW